jgi:hypothetical protein
LCGRLATSLLSLRLVLPLLAFISTYLITQFTVIGILTILRDPRMISNTDDVLVSL